MNGRRSWGEGDIVIVNLIYFDLICVDVVHLDYVDFVYLI